MTMTTSLENVTPAATQQQLLAMEETQRRTIEYTENTILAIADVDQDAEAERVRAEAAMLAQIAAQSLFIQQLQRSNG